MRAQLACLLYRLAMAIDPDAELARAVIARGWTSMRQEAALTAHQQYVAEIARYN